MLKKRQNNSEEQNNSKAQNNAVESFFSALKQGLEKIRRLAEQEEWFDLFLYLGAILFVAFLPGSGLLYFLARPLINAILGEVRYEYFFAGVIFLLFVLYLLLKAYEVARKSRRKTRLSAVIFIISLGLAVASLLSIRLSFLPDSLKNNISWGEQTLFAKHGPEAMIYDTNRRALENYSSPLRSPSLFHSPLKVAVSLPISRKDGPFQSEEVLRGVATAQIRWNEAENHKNSQMVVAIADDGGYSESNEVPANDITEGEEAQKVTGETFEQGETQAAEGEKEEAQKVAREITSDKRILGAIGHFSSTATEAAADIYKKDRVVLISPTSTAVRCPDDEADSEGVLEGCLRLNPYIFRTALSDDVITRNVIAYIRNRKADIRKIAIVYETDDRYSLLYKRIFIREAEQDRPEDPSERIVVINKKQSTDEPFDECNISRSDEPFTASGCLSKAEENGADAILLAPSTKNSIMVENVLAANSEKFRLDLLGSDSMYQENFIKINGKARSETNGLLIPLSWHRDQAKCSPSEGIDERLECETREVLADYVEDELKSSFQPLLISWRTKMGYDAATALFQAINASQRRCGLQSYFGRRANCIKNHLQNELAEKRDSYDESRKIAFRDGDRTGIGTVIVEVIKEEESASFSKIYN